MKYIVLFVFLINSSFAKESFLDSVKRMKWKVGNDTIDVVWIKDDKFPKFTASIYFQDGALNDVIPGLTQVTFDQMTSGTSKQTQRELLEFFDFYGAELKHTVTHEYSVFNIQALTKDIRPVMGKVCELFQDAQFPENELNSHLSRAKSHLKNLVTSHANLADRVFRRISLKETPYSVPVDGTLDGFNKINSKALKERLSSLNQARKTLYLAGPSDIWELERILENCSWSNKEKLNKLEITKPKDQHFIYLVEVPGANQAQIRIGRYMGSKEFEGKFDHFQFMSSFLGGGFTSKLVQELRVKRGLTYSAGAYVSMQRDYARAGIITFSKNETAAETISIIRDVFSNVSQNKFEDKEFDHQKSHLIGGYAFSFEETNAFLAQLMLYDHQKRDLKELVNFPKTIEEMQRSDLARSCKESFPWEKQTIVVVGDKGLIKSLSKIRKVKVVQFQDYL